MLGVFVRVGNEGRRGAGAVVLAFQRYRAGEVLPRRHRGRREMRAAVNGRWSCFDSVWEQ